MKKLFFLTCCLWTVFQAFGWGQKGHDVTAYIAECHLTPEAAERIDKLLGGRSLVYYANWMDIASYTPQYAYTRTWHYLNIDEGETYESMEKHPDGDILTAVTLLVDKLRGGGLEATEEAAALKMLVHLLGDMHCPLHTGRRTDTGGNLVPVKVFGTETNLHSAWDTAIPEAAHRWSYSEWQREIDRLSDDEAVLIVAGEPRDWIGETHALCCEVYRTTPAGTEISYDYIDRATPVIERQLLKGGYRLARLLNEIYQ